MNKNKTNLIPLNDYVVIEEQIPTQKEGAIVLVDESVRKSDLMKAKVLAYEPDWDSIVNIGNMVLLNRHMATPVADIPNTYLVKVENIFAIIED